MSAHALARQLFASPGAATAHTRHLLAQAAGSHARLLESAGAAHHERVLLSLPPSATLRRVAGLAKLLESEVTAAGLVLALVGFVSHARRRLRGMGMLFALFAASLLYSLLVNQAPLGITPFGIVPALIVSFGIAAGVDQLLGRARQNGIVSGLTAAAVLAALPLVMVVKNFHACDRSYHSFARDHARNILDTVPGGGILHARGDNSLFPVLYEKVVRGRRPDVTLMVRGIVVAGPQDGAGAGGDVMCTESRLADSAAERLHPVGLLYGASRASSEHVRALWAGYRLDILDRSPAQEDYMTREVMAGLHYRRAEFLRSEGREEDAARALQRAAEAGRDIARIRLLVGTGFREMGLPWRAAGEFESAALVEPWLAAPHLELGSIYDDEGYKEKAGWEYREALRLDPHLAAACNNLGRIVAEQGKLEEAAGLFRRAVSDAERAEMKEAAEQNLRRVIEEMGR